MTYQYIIFIILLSQTYLCGRDTVYALLAIDTRSTDIHHSTPADAKMVYNLVWHIPQENGLVKTRLLQGEHLNLKNILAWVASIPPGKADRIFFYYSGHGKRSSSLSSPWPTLVLRHGLEEVESSNIRDALLKKKPKLLVSMTDCCNSPEPVTPIRWPPTLAPPDVRLNPPYTQHVQRQHTPRPQKISKRFRKNIKRLFRQSRGVVTITASRPGMPAGAAASGGLMTKFLYRTIARYGGKKITWKTLFRQVAKQGKFFHQTPHYEIRRYRAGGSS